MTPNEAITQLKEKATTFARKHATQNAKAFYLLGKRDAASAILSMIKEDGVSAIEDVAKELLKHDPNHVTAKWILENQIQWKTT